MESQDCEPKLELLLSQLSDPPFQLLQPPIRDETRPSKRHKQSHLEQLGMEIFKTMLKPW
jgi:hypothetical protein